MRARAAGAMRSDDARTVALVLLVTLVAASGLARSVSSVVTVEALAFFPYAMLLARGPDAAPPVRVTLLLATLAMLPSLAAPPTLSDDVYRYLWDGRVLTHGISPYAHAPDDPSLAFLRDDRFLAINHPQIATIYPPVAALAFALLSPLGLFGLKLLALVAHLGTAIVVACLAHDRARAAAVAYALNPLALLECARSGHVDALAVLFLALATLALVRGKAGRAAVFAALASGTKLLGLLFVPILASRSRRAAFAALGLSLLFAVPLATSGGSSDRAGLANFARRWRGNDGAYGVIESAYTRALLRCCLSDEDRVDVPAVRAVAARVANTPLDPRHTFRGPKKEPDTEPDFHITTIAPFLARATVACLVIALALALSRRRVEPVLAMRHVLLALLLLSPQVHPWYVLLLLPFEAAADRVAGFVFSAAVLVAYAPLEAWSSMRVWHDPVVPRLVEHALVIAVVAIEETLRRADQRGLVLS